MTVNLAYDTNLNQRLNSGGSLLMAYALNLKPDEALADHLPKAEVSSDALSIDYHGASVGVTYRVEASKDLETWVTTGVVTSEPDADGIRTASIARDAGCGFLRLVVTEN